MWNNIWFENIMICMICLKPDHNLMALRWKWYKLIQTRCTKWACVVLVTGVFSVDIFVHSTLQYFLPFLSLSLPKRSNRKHLLLRVIFDYHLSFIVLSFIIYHILGSIPSFINKCINSYLIFISLNLSKL